MNSKRNNLINDKAINTYQMLFICYMSPIIPLEVVVRDYLHHMSIEIAKRKAFKQELPFPIIRLGDKQKASWAVNIADLAQYIDKQTKLAQEDFKAMNK